MPMHLLTVLLLANFGVVDASVLIIDRTHKEDSAFYPTDDPAVSYAVTQIEAASLHPFCLSIERIAFSECYRAGYVKRLLPTNARAGHSGEAISVTVRSPVLNDSKTINVLVRMIVTESGGTP